MKKRQLGIMAAIVAMVLIVTGVVAYAASFTYNLAGGDSLTVKCAGRSLQWQSRSNSTTVTLKCQPSATPTSSPSTSPSITPSTTPSTSPTSSPSSSPTSTGYSCTTSVSNGNCGPYASSKITNSNGYNTYVGNNCWGDPQCRQTISANSASDWKVNALEPANNTAVMTYPDVQQETNNWGGSGFVPCGGPNNCVDVPLAGLSALTSSYDETMTHGSGVIAQAAYDLWISNAAGHSDEIMVWMDNSGRGTGGASFYGTYTVNGQPWSLYHYGTINDETIWMPGTQNQFAQQSSGTVDLKALLDQLVTLGLENANLTLGQIDFGWEVCSTGGVARDFVVHDYSLTLTAS